MIAGKMMELMDDMAHQRDRLNKRLTRERESRIRSATRQLKIVCTIMCALYNSQEKNYFFCVMLWNPIA